MSWLSSGNWHHGDLQSRAAPMVGGVYNQGTDGTCYAYAVAQLLVEASSRVYGRAPLNTKRIVDSLVGIYGTDGGYPLDALNEACDVVLEKYGWIYNSRVIRPLDLGDHTLTLARPFVVVMSLTTSQWIHFTKFFENAALARKKAILSNLPKPSLGEKAGGHAILVVAQNTASKEGPYWKFRNSWGSDFADCGDCRLTKELTESISSSYLEVSWNESELSPERRKQFKTDLALRKPAAVEHQQRYFSSTFVLPWKVIRERAPEPRN
jgi:hypothetical protein